LANLVAMTDGQPENPELRQAYERVTGIVESLKDINDTNTILIANALDYINFTLNMIQSSLDENPSFSDANQQVEGTFFDAQL
jgi:flagellar biosynthesis/type III secretory pathway chaperone